MATPRWFIARNNDKVGPFSGSEIKQMATFGLLQPAEFLWADGATKWVAAASVPGLFPPVGQKKYWLNLGGQTRPLRGRTDSRRPQYPAVQSGDPGPTSIPPNGCPWEKSAISTVTFRFR